MGPMLQKRSLHAAVTLKGQVFVIGGWVGMEGWGGSSSTETTGTTTEFLPAGGTTWQQGPQLPVEMRNGPCAVAISPTSFLVFHKKEIREFDASTAGPTSIQGWAEETKWPKLETSRRRWLGCAKLGDDKVVIAGGSDSQTMHQTTEILDLSTRTLSQGGKMATPRRWFRIISFYDSGVFRTLAVGGSDGVKDLNTVEEWQLKTESWSTVETQLKVKRSYFGLVAVNKNLVCPSQ